MAKKDKNLGLKSSHDPPSEQETINLEMLDLEKELAGWQFDDVPMPSVVNSPQTGSHESSSSKTWDFLLEHDLASFQDNGWDVKNILDGIRMPSPVSSPDVAVHEPNLTPHVMSQEEQQQDLKSSAIETLPTHENEDPVIELATTPICKEQQQQDLKSSAFESLPTRQNEDSVMELATAPIREQNLETDELANSLGEDKGSNASNTSDSRGMTSFVTNSQEEQQQELKSSIFETLPTRENEEPITELDTATNPVHNLNGSVIATQNRSETTEAASDKANDSSFENPVASTPSGEDTSPLPQSLPNCSAQPLNASPISHSLTSITEARPMIETGHSSGQFVTNQRFESKNSIIDPDTARACKWIEDQLLHDDEQYGPNYMQFDSFTSDRILNSFQALLQEGDHAHAGTQKIHDLQSQKSVQPVRRTLFPRSEPHSESHIQPFFVPVAPNSHAHQHSYRPALPKPTVPNSVYSLSNSHAHQHGYRPALPKPTVPNSVPAVPSNYHPQHHPSPHAMTYNSFGSGLQFLISQGVPQQMNEYNPRLNTPVFQQQNYTLHEPKALPSTSQKGMQAPMSSMTDELKEYYEIRRKLLDMMAKAERTVTPNYPQQNRSGSFAPIKIAAPLESTVVVEQDKQPRRRGRPPKHPGLALSSPKPPAQRGRPPKRCEPPDRSFPPSKHPRM